MSSINPLTGEAADCITIAGPDGVNKVGPSKFSPQLPEELDVDPASPLKPQRPPDYETVSIKAPGKFTVLLEKPFVNDNPHCVSEDRIDLVCLMFGSKTPTRFTVPRKSNKPEKPKRTEQLFEDLKNRRPGSPNDDIATSYAYPYVFGSPYAFGYQPRVIHAPVW